MDISVCIHKTSEVDPKRYNHVKGALESMGSQLDHNFTTTEGRHGLDNSKAPDESTNSAMSKFLNYCEDNLHEYNWLDQSSLHVVIYHSTLNWDTSHGPAGFAQWHVGDPNSNGYWTGSRDYPNDGAYSIACINAATGNTPYTKKHFKGTVIHEVGHNFTCDHKNGEIQSKYSNGSLNYYASPMCTWYVEQPCAAFPTSNDSLSTLCNNDKDKNHACNHTLTMSNTSCETDLTPTRKIINNWVSNHSSDIKS